MELILRVYEVQQRGIGSMKGIAEKELATQHTLGAPSVGII